MVHKILERALVPREGATVLESQSALAERFEFESDPCAVVRSLIGGGSLDWSSVRETARPVASAQWTEWPCAARTRRDGWLREGALTYQYRDKTRVVQVIETTDGIAAPILCFSIEQMPRRSAGVEVHWSLCHERHDETLEQTVMVAYADLVEALFMICTPRVSDQTRERPPRHERRRALREHRLPPLEFVRVRMVVGEAPPRYASNSTAEERRREDEEYTRRRLHRVMGHFRVYEKGREQKLVSFVPEHWRGDAELGIVMHDRTVVQREKVT